MYLTTTMMILLSLFCLLIRSHQKKKPAVNTPHSLFVRRTRIWLIGRVTEPVMNVDTDIPSSPESTVVQDAIHFCKLPIERVNGIAECVLDSDKNASPGQLKRTVDQFFPFPSTLKKRKAKKTCK